MLQSNFLSSHSSFRRNLLVVGLIFTALGSCRYFSFQDQEITYGGDEYYIFNPSTIMDDINDGKSDIFISQNVTPAPPLSEPLSRVQWNERDYLAVVHMLSELTWSESIDHWNLRHASLSLRCEDISLGPQFGFFVYFKEEKNQEGDSLIERQIYIDPSNNSAHWSEVRYYPNLIHPKSIELDEYVLSVRDALQIAEQNGGEQVRNRIDNNCNIRVELFNSGDNWRISYVEVLDLFVMDINAFTGTYEIVVDEK